MKKLLALLMAALFVFALSACGSNSNNEDTTESGKQAQNTDTQLSIDAVKVGLICLHDENSTYDLNFIKAMNEAKEELGLKDDQV
ncbi:MAG: BMP family ABC transporter substrate-binding protein, partial [Clostridia bacterium]|nr:BMP family ABC transporter substrate-binding protein [Clostridia bacterium]